MTEPPVTGGTDAHTARFPTETPPAAASGHVTAGGTRTAKGGHP